MMIRYLFALAAVDRPVGGRNVLIWAIEHLTRTGVAAHPVYPYRGYRYAFADTSARAFFDPRLRGVFARGRGDAISRRLTDALRRDDTHPRLELRPDDVLVIPEFRYPEVAALYPGHRRVLFAQDVFGFARAHSRDVTSGGRAIEGFGAVMTTSEASQAAVRTLSGRDSLRLRLPLTGHRFGETKKKIVAYMPRKRPQEAEIVVTALRQMPEFADWEFVRIAGMSPDALRRLYEEALVFLSFSKQEGFGLPPAEAMSAGCVVIGYTGVGGEEYFDATTGFPIPDSDIIAFIDTAREVARLHATDPARLDRLRRAAAARIVSEYALDKAEAALEAAWSTLESHGR